MNFEGPLRPHAFDCTKLTCSQPSPWNATELLQNAAVRLRFWNLDGNMRQLARNADGDELLFVHAGRGELFCDYGHLSFEAGDYILIPRGTMWRVECAEALRALLIEATNNSFRLPDKGLVGPHAIFDAAMLDTPRIDQAFRDQQDEAGQDLGGRDEGRPQALVRQLERQPHQGRRLHPRAGQGDELSDKVKTIIAVA